MIATSLTLSLVAFAYLGISIIVGARHNQHYNHVRQTISELGEHGSEFEQHFSLGVFLPIGILLSVVAWLLRSTDPQIALLSLSIAVGYGLSAAFPCDPGSPMTGSFRQAIHNLGGGIEYVGGAFSLLWISETTGPTFRVAGLLVAASAILLSFESPIRGLIQRIAEICLFVGLVVAIWVI